jgi:hypothetical protein
MAEDAGAADLTAEGRLKLGISRASGLRKLHWIQHSCGNRSDHAKAVVRVDNAPGAALFAISIANYPPVKRVSMSL